MFRRVQEAGAGPERAASGGQYIAGVDVGFERGLYGGERVDAESKEMVYLDRFNRVDYPVLMTGWRACTTAITGLRWWLETNSIGRP